MPTVRVVNPRRARRRRGPGRKGPLPRTREPQAESKAEASEKESLAGAFAKFHFARALGHRADAERRKNGKEKTSQQSTPTPQPHAPHPPQQSCGVSGAAAKAPAALESPHQSPSLPAQSGRARDEPRQDREDDGGGRGERYRHAIGPQLILGANNAGVVGYAANAATAFVSGLVAKWIGGQDAAVGAIIGGGTALVQRIVSDLMGSKLGDLDLSGDLDFDLGFYIGNSFPLPTAGNGPYLLNPGYSGQPMPSVSVGGPAMVSAALPAAAAAAAAGGGHHGMGADDRWSSRWSN